jgi:hypothetical protein
MRVDGKEGTWDQGWQNCENAPGRPPAQASMQGQGWYSTGAKRKGAPGCSLSLTALGPYSLAAATPRSERGQRSELQVMMARVLGRPTYALSTHKFHL